VGKTALLEYAIDSAADLNVLRAAGVESDMELAFAGVHHASAPLLGGLDGLPGPQRAALETAFGLAEGSAPDRFLVGLAMLSLLSAVAEERPVLCVVDDAQWLDRSSAQVMAFVSRRLLAESVLMLFGMRELGEEFRALPELVVEGLGDADARALLSSVVGGRLDERVSERILAETRGNPLALLELPRGLSSAELAGGFGLPDLSPLAGRIEETFLRRLEPLPAETRFLLLVAAADPVGDPALLWRVASLLGIEREALAPAVSAGLLEVDSRVRFRHPLVRSAVYRTASVDDRRRAHGGLAGATDPQVDPDRRAWHRAQATSGPDEHVAAELERSAGRAQARGGLAAAAAFLERAVWLTSDPALQAERALAAAQAKQLAGASYSALALLGTAEAGPLDELQGARANLLRAQIAFISSRGSDAPPLLLQAAKLLEPLDAVLARDTYLEAFSSAVFAERLATNGGMHEVAEAVRGLPSSEPPRVADLLLDGLAIMVAEGVAAAAPTLKQSLTAARRADIPQDEALRWLWLASQIATRLWDDDSWYQLTIRHVSVARDAGAFSVLPIALFSRFGLHLLAGEFVEAASVLQEIALFTEAAGTHLATFNSVTLAAFQGDEAEVDRLAATLRGGLQAGGGIALGAVQWSRSVLANGLGRHEEALRAAEKCLEYSHAGYWALSELIEATVRIGKPERAGYALGRLSEMTRASGANWGLGVEARSRALLSDGHAAEDLYNEAIDRLGRTRMRVDLARGHLLYGEWLRRAHRRLDAREQLRTAHDLFIAMGAEAFAQRTQRELMATGERVRKRTVETRDQLTPQEGEVARLAHDGLSNAEIGARLFISPRTVEYHLHKVFKKLDITSRSQLHRALPEHAPPASAA
jgi:DNA-binding CsgD family transcriptional regulator/tetratricopeptide (TPR) repeat protein